MKTLFPVALVGLLIASCANDPYQNLPEGSVSTSQPSGYEEMVYGGVSYWYRYGHYYRHWPSHGWVVVRPPQNRPPYPKPPPRPVHPIAPPPGNRPPSVQPLPATPPAQRPVTRPSTPSYRPPSTMPAARPATMPRARPALR